MNEHSLARSACRIFGHKWGEVKYHASRTADPYRRARTLTIQRQRVCLRCGEVEVRER